jgi:hypothetical protein
MERLFGVAVARHRIGAVGGIIHLVVGRLSLRFQPAQLLLVAHG